jgi:hypothetical protein
MTLQEPGVEFILTPGPDHGSTKKADLSISFAIMRQMVMYQLLTGPRLHNLFIDDGRVIQIFLGRMINEKTAPTPYRMNDL